MTVFKLSKELVFPSPEDADPDGLLAVGGDLIVKRLLLAYQMGIFPWYSTELPILWWSPDPRLILRPKHLTISRRLMRLIKQGSFKVTLDQAFSEVMRECARVKRPSQNDTWITDDMIEAYCQLHQEGYAHSVESWQDGELVGGLYGISLGRAFFGESMFSRESNAPKVAFVHLVWFLSNISFTVRRGEVVGLLGPNGAGKSTTMRILSCFLPATTGTVKVAGYDVYSESDEVRRRIGYMPENNPLHHDMRVREYLRFRAQLKGLSRKRSRERVDTVTAQCALTDVTGRIIGQLSKGYRQRVGLADALVHEPELIILDEPTIGLDPNQIRSVRQLIKGLASVHTVLISTHILPEAEMTCSRMVIMFEGQILAADTPEDLQRLMSSNSQVFIVDLARAHAAKPVYVTFMGAHEHDVAAKAYLEPRGVPCYMEVEEPFEALAVLAALPAAHAPRVWPSPRAPAGTTHEQRRQSCIEP